MLPADLHRCNESPHTWTRQSYQKQFVTLRSGKVESTRSKTLARRQRTNE